MTKHTPTPWFCEMAKTSSGRAYRIGAKQMLSPGIGACIIYDDYPSKADNENQANAAFIVRACNAHDALVEALETIILECGNQKDGEGYKVISNIASAALALAKGD